MTALDISILDNQTFKDALTAALIHTEINDNPELLFISSTWRRADAESKAEQLRVRLRAELARRAGA